MNPYKLVFVLGITNMVFGLLVLFSCRCMLGTFVKKLYNYNWYRKFYKYHCYYWWIFFVSVFLHSFLALGY